MNPSPLLRAAMLLLVATSAVHAQSGTVSVDTRSNLYLAGGNAGSGDGLTPTAINLTAGLNRILTVSSATGSAFFCTNTCPGTPEGGAIGATDVNTSGSIAGVQAPTSGFLAALFLGPSLPGTAPARLDFNALGLDFASLSPALGQVFFVGNGLTSGGATQTFLVPDGATRLYFGIADAFGFVGNPDFYGDNVGSYGLTYAVVGSNVVPEPSTVLLLGAGMAVLGLVGRKRRGIRPR